jgi:WD40 repeat protein
MPYQTMRGYTDQVRGVVHLPGGRRIITCSWDGSPRLWDLGNGTHMGGDWRDAIYAVRCVALSPNGKRIVSGSDDGKLRLWNVERKVISKWTGHADAVFAMCLSADCERVASGSWDRTARVWNVKKGKTVLTTKTEHNWTGGVMYSPNSLKLATSRDCVKTWDAKTGELLNTLKQTGFAVWHGHRTGRSLSPV